MRYFSQKKETTIIIESRIDEQQNDSRTAITRRRKNINIDDNVNRKIIVILTYFIFQYSNETISAVLIIPWYFIFSLLYYTHTHIQDRLLARLSSSLPFTSFFLYYLLLLLLLLLVLLQLASSFCVRSLSLMHFCILPHEYATQRETYTSNKLSLDINRTLDFTKYFLFLTCFLSFFPLIAYVVKDYKRTEQKNKNVLYCFNFVCLHKNWPLSRSSLSYLVFYLSLQMNFKKELKFEIFKKTKFFDYNDNK